MSTPPITPGRPSRPARNPPFQLRRLGDGDLAYSPSPPIFQQLTADTLGNAGSTTDGYDAAFQDVATAFGGESGGLSALGADLQAAAFTAGEIEAAVLHPVGEDLAAAIADAGGIVSDLASSFGGDISIGAPPDPGTPPPVSIGDFGLGGSGGIPGGGQLPNPTTVTITDLPGGPSTTPNPPPGSGGNTGDFDIGTGVSVPSPGDSIPPPPELPTDIPLTPVDVPPPDVLPPDDAGNDGGFVFGGGGGGGGGDGAGRISFEIGPEDDGGFAPLEDD